MSACPICNNERDVKNIGTHADYKLAFCDLCHIRFSDPMSEPNTEFYNHSSLYQERELQKDFSNPKKDWRFSTFFKIYNKSKGARILDVGCGDGGFLQLASSYEMNVFGIDFDKRAVDIAKNIRGITNVSCSTIDELLSRRDIHFDVITMFDVLEHVPDPKKSINDIKKLLVSDGTLCLSLPHYDRSPKIFDKEADFPPHHFTLWTLTSVEKLLNQCGFKIIKLIEKPLMLQDCLHPLIWSLRRRRGGIPGNKNSFLNENKNIKSISYLLKKVLKSIYAIAAIFINWFMKKFQIGRGHTIMVFARK